MSGGELPVQHWDLGIGPISCHTWNKDKTQLAASASNNIIHIFTFVERAWKEIHVLKEHDLLITGLDWAPNTNRIVSCSQDKNAFVWTLVDGVWKPELVIVRSNRAATCVKWSPQENKFAVGTGACMVSICYYERENDWWLGKQIKKPIRSTVTSLNWHPNNILLAIGACDFKTRVFSAYIKETDDKQPAPNPWGTKMPFGALLWEHNSLGWILDVAFSPSGCRLAWVAHDCSISVVDKTDANGTKPVVFKTNYLPFTSIHWATESSIIAAGHDCSPVLFKYADQALSLVLKLDVPPEENKNQSVNSAFKMFQNFDRRAVESVPDVRLKTLHQNAISQVQPYSGRNDNINKFSTCGIDGLVALWDLQKRTASAK